MKFTDAIFYHGKASGGINTTTVNDGTDDWEVQELLNDDGKVYFKLAILWNDKASGDFKAIRKKYFDTPVDPTDVIANPLEA
jgi:hypothetical protein